MNVYDSGWRNRVTIVGPAHYVAVRHRVPVAEPPQPPPLFVNKSGITHYADCPRALWLAGDMTRAGERWCHYCARRGSAR